MGTGAGEKERRWEGVIGLSTSCSRFPKNVLALSKLSCLNVAPKKKNYGVSTGSPYKRRICLYVRNIKKCMGILKSHIVNIYRVMPMLKLKINVNLPELSCIVETLQYSNTFLYIFNIPTDTPLVFAPCGVSRIKDGTYKI